MSDRHPVSGIEVRCDGKIMANIGEVVFYNNFSRDSSDSGIRVALAQAFVDLLCFAIVLLLGDQGTKYRSLLDVGVD